MFTHPKPHVMWTKVELKLTKSEGLRHGWNSHDLSPLLMFSDLIVRLVKPYQELFIWMLSEFRTQLRCCFLFMTSCFNEKKKSIATVTGDVSDRLTKNESEDENEASVLCFLTSTAELDWQQNIPPESWCSPDQLSWPPPNMTYKWLFGFLLHAGPRETPQG